MEYFFRSPYNYSMDDVSRETGLECLDPSLTVQDAAEDADVNTIARRFGLTGDPSLLNVRAPTYGDFTGVTTYQDALTALQSAQASFSALPAEVRERFRNDPGAFVAFCSDSSNADELVRLGLRDRPIEPPPASQPGGPVGGGAAQGDGA